MEIISINKSVSLKRIISAGPYHMDHSIWTVWYGKYHMAPKPTVKSIFSLLFSRDNSTTRLGSIDSLGTMQPDCTGTTGRDNTSNTKTVWDRMVETLNNTSITHPLGYRMSDTNVYYEEMDRKWRDLIIFFNKCQVFVGIGP